MTSQTSPPDDLQPLSPIFFHIMVALADGEKHGYGIMKAIEQETSGQVLILTGTLYRNIKRMIALGLIAETEDRPDPALDDERRRYYRLSATGQTVLSAEARRMAHTLQVLEHKHLFGGV